MYAGLFYQGPRQMFVEGPFFEGLVEILLCGDARLKFEVVFHKYGL